MDGIVPADGASAVLTLATSNRPWDLDEVRLPRTPYNTLTP